MPNNLLEPNYWSIKQLFDFQYHVPVYQRPYSWQTDQVDSLYNDILEAFGEYQATPENSQYLSGLYVGNIILHSRNVGMFDIIDGQQRITTFALMIMALYAKSIELSATTNERVVQKLQAALWKLDGADNPQIEKRAIMLGSIDKEMMMKIFDNASYFPEKLHQFIVQYSPRSDAEVNLKENFLKIYDHLTTCFQTLDDLLLFANFLLQKVYLIAIITYSSEVKAFSIFEAINSKGKKLEDIDLIKTFIFSRLNEADYASCLSQWGDLILKTEDALYDYLKTYIKAYIKYYSQNISFNNFKRLGDVLCEHFNKNDLGEAYKELLSDMLEKVKYYRALTDLDSAYALVHDSKFRFYYSVFIKIKYELPNPLFFRLFSEYGNGNISKDALIEIVVETIKSVVSFITICQKDSKDIINVFSSIFDGISKNNIVDKDLILYLLGSKMQTSGLRKEDVSSSLSKMDLYEKNKQLGVAIISVYESRTNGRLSVSWDEAYSKFSTFGRAYSLDHIMVQTPRPTDERLKYYKLGDTLKLKKGHDFPETLVHDGMEYSAFKNLVLHRAGNLRLKGRDENSDRSNMSDDTLYTYAGLDEKTNQIVNFIMENFLNFESITETASIASALSSMPKKQVGTFDLSLDDLDLTGIKAKQLTVFDQSFELEHNKDILIKIAYYLYKYENGDKLLSMAAHNWSPRRRVILSNESTQLLSPYELLKDQIYIETNLNSKDIIFYSKEMLREFNFPADLVSIYVPE